jgi:hypothetical protein
MATLDWSECQAVESVPGKVSGAWVFKGTRTPVAVVFENRWKLIKEGLAHVAGSVRCPTRSCVRGRHSRFTTLTVALELARIRALVRQSRWQ